MAHSQFKYKITADDYLTHQLFEVSRNPIVKNQRKKGLILWTVVFFIFALVFWFQDNRYMALYLALFGIGFIFVYPFYSRWIYKRYYTRYIKKMLKEREGEDMALQFQENDILISNGNHEGRMPNTDIIGIYEIPTHVFLKLTQGKNIIIPKLKIENIQELQGEIVLLTEKYNIEYTRLLQWKW